LSYGCFVGENNTTGWRGCHLKSDTPTWLGHGNF